MYTKLIQIHGSKKKVALHIFLLSLLIYFVFHAVAGNRGILAYFKLNKKLEESSVELDHLKAERIELEHKVRLLKPPVDLDMLDEQARRVLGVAKPNEKVFVVEDKSNK
ncbi:MAG: septum formation initiator family protein [Pseudomonadota bacterium]